MKILRSSLPSGVRLGFISGCQTQTASSGDYPLTVFKVEDTSDNINYLLGTIHVGAEDLCPLRKEVKVAFEESDYLAVEFNLILIQANDFNPSKYPISFQNLSTKTLAYFEDILKTYLASYNRLSIAPVHLMTQKAANETGLQMELGMDSYFLECEKHGKPIIEMEDKVAQFEMVYELDQCCTNLMINSLLPLLDATLQLTQLYDSVLNRTVNAEDFEQPSEQCSINEVESFSNLLFHNLNKQMAQLVET